MDALESDTGFPIDVYMGILRFTCTCPSKKKGQVSLFNYTYDRVARITNETGRPLSKKTENQSTRRLSVGVHADANNNR